MGYREMKMQVFLASSLVHCNYKQTVDFIMPRKEMVPGFF